MAIVVDTAAFGGGNAFGWIEGVALSWFPNHVFLANRTSLWHAGEASAECLWLYHNSALAIPGGCAVAVDHRRQVAWVHVSYFSSSTTSTLRKVWWEEGKWRFGSRTLHRPETCLDVVDLAPTVRSDGKLLVWDGGLDWRMPGGTTVEPVLVNGDNYNSMPMMSKSGLHVAADDSILVVTLLKNFTIDEQGREKARSTCENVVIDGAKSVVGFDVLYSSYSSSDGQIWIRVYDQPDAPPIPYRETGIRTYQSKLTAVLHSGQILCLDSDRCFCTAAAAPGVVPPRPPPWRLLEHRALWSTVPWIQRFVTTVLLCALRNDRDPVRTRLPLDVWERVIALVPTHAMQPPPQPQ